MNSFPSFINSLSMQYCIFVLTCNSYIYINVLARKHLRLSHSCCMTFLSSKPVVDVFEFEHELQHEFLWRKCHGAIRYIAIDNEILHWMWLCSYTEIFFSSFWHRFLLMGVVWRWIRSFQRSLQMLSISSSEIAFFLEPMWGRRWLLVPVIL